MEEPFAGYEATVEARSESEVSQRDENNLEEKVEDEEAKQRAKEERELQDTVSLLQNLVTIPYKTKLKWTNHHRSTIASFVSENEQQFMCFCVMTDSTFPRLIITYSLPTTDSLIWYFFKTDQMTKISKENFTTYLRYGNLMPSDTREIEIFLLNVYRTSLISALESELNIDNSCDSSSMEVSQKIHSDHCTLVDLPRYMYLLGSQVAFEVGVSINQPALYVPKELLSLSAAHPEEKHILNVEFQSRLEEKLLGTLYGVTKSQEVGKVLNYLREGQSPIPILFYSVVQVLEEALNDVAHETQCLLPLKPVLSLLYKDPQYLIINHMYNILALLRILWEDSKFHHDEDVMLELCTKAFWEVTRSCQIHLPLDFLSPQPLLQDLEDVGDDSVSSDMKRILSSPIDAAINCCKEWRNGYMQLSDHFKEIDSPEVWLPQTPGIFLPVELFASRCEDLRYIWLSKTQLTRHTGEKGKVLSMKGAASEFGDAWGTEGEMLEEELSQVDKVLSGALKTISKKTHFVFNLTSKEWLKHFDRYKESIEEVERRYQCVMIAAVQIVMTASQGLYILNVFRPLAARKSLFPVFFVMIDHILDLLEREMEAVEKEYVFRSMNVGSSGFSYSGMAKWAINTRKKLNHEIQVLKQQTWLPYYSRLDSVYGRWGKICNLLKNVTTNMFAAWKVTIEPSPAKRLLEPIFCWRPGQVQALEDNFDKSLFGNLEESRNWKELGFDIPENLLNLYGEFANYSEWRERVNECTNQFNSLMLRVSRDEAQLFEAHIARTVKTYYAGLTIVNWTQSQQISTLLDRCKKSFSFVDTEITYYLKYNESLSNKFFSIKQMIICPTRNKLYVKETFVEEIEESRVKVIREVKSLHKKTEEGLDTLHLRLVSKHFPKTQTAWLSYVYGIDSLFLECQLEIKRKSMLAFEGLLIESRNCPASQLQPVFSITLVLASGKIICDPLLSELNNALKCLEELYLDGFEKITCFLCKYDNEQAVSHNHSKLLQDEVCSKIQKKLIEEFDKQSEKLEIYLEKWEEHQDLWKIDKDEFFNYYLNRSDTSMFDSDMESLDNKLERISNLDECSSVGIFFIDCSKLKNQLVKLCSSWKSLFHDSLYKITCKKLETLVSHSAGIESLLNLHPDDISSLLKMIEECNAAKVKRITYKDEFEPVMQQFNTLQRCHYSVSGDVQSQLDELQLNWKNAGEKLDKKISMLHLELAEYRKIYSDKREDIIREIDYAKENYYQMIPTRLDKNYDEAVQVIEILIERINKCKEVSELNAELNLLSLSSINFGEIDLLENDLKTLKRLWDIHKQWLLFWEQTSGCKVSDVCIALLQDTILLYRENIVSALATYVGAEKEVICSKWEIYQDLINTMEYSKKLIPLVSNLQVTKLQPHHWFQIKSLIKKEFDETSASFTLDLLQNLNLTSYGIEIEKIILQANEERILMNDFAEIDSASHQIVLQLQQIHNMGLYVLDSSDEAYSSIYDLNICLQKLSSSKAAKPYADKINHLNNVLISMLVFLRETEQTQEKWALWEPFFYAYDTKLHIQNEASKFFVINEKWRQVSLRMNAVKFLRAISSQDDIFEEIRNINAGVNRNIQTVKEYLQERRELFSRLCFLTDEDLIMAISRVIDEESVKPYLLYIFSNIWSIKCQKNSQFGCPEITGVYSFEGEFLELNSYVPLRGNFDIWLRAVLNKVESTLQESVKQCRSTLKTVGNRIDELLKIYPFQAVFLSYYIQWSIDVVRIKPKSKGSNEIISSLGKKLKDALVRLQGTLETNISKVLRKKVQLFCLILLQLRDQLQMISHRECYDSDASDCIAKYVWGKDSKELNFEMCSAVHKYTWEYQGVDLPGVVSTSASWKMIYNILRFLHQNMYITVCGEPGSGKSHTIKTVANFLGRHLHSVNYGDISSRELTTLVFGTSQTYSWLHFQDPLSHELLSILSDLILIRKQAQQQSLQKSLKSDRLLNKFEGINVTIEHTSAVFLEMNVNPEISDVSEIIRDHFHPLLMSYPSIQVLAESYLTLSGFKDPHNIAKQLEGALTDLSYALPLFYRPKLGIKAACSIVSYMEQTSKDQKELHHVDILPLAIKEYLLPQLNPVHTEIFKELYSCLFPDLDTSLATDELIKETIVADMKTNGFEPNETFVEQLMQLHQTLNWNKLVVLSGKPKCGKSSSIQILSNVYNKLTNEGHIQRFVSVSSFIPIILKNEVLYGKSKGKLSHIQGLIPKEIITANYAGGEECWIIVEGPDAGSWVMEFCKHIKGRNYDKFMCNNGETIFLSDNIKFVIEVCDIPNLTPNFFQRCCFVHFDEQETLWKSIINSWCHSLPYSVGQTVKLILSKHLSNFVDILPKEYFDSSRLMTCAKTFVALMKYFLKDEISCVREISISTNKVMPIILFSVVWSFGADLSEIEIRKMTEMFFKIIESVSQEEGIYGYFVDSRSGDFLSWNDVSKNLIGNDYCEVLHDKEIKIVNTVKVIKYNILLNILLSSGISVLLKGENGCGKTFVMRALSTIPNKEYEVCCTSYNITTKPWDIEESIKTKLTLHGKNIYRAAKQKVCVFIDDVHLTEDEIERCQIQCLIKNVQNENKIYNENSGSYCILPPTTFLVCGLGLYIDQCLGSWSKYLHVMALPPLEEEEMVNIFSLLFMHSFGHFEQDIKAMRQQIGSALIFIYNEIKRHSLAYLNPSTAYLLVHPRQVFGFLRALELTEEEMLDQDSIIQFTVHEIFSIFKDISLMSNHEFCSLVQETADVAFHRKTAGYIKNLESNVMTKIGNQESMYQNIAVKEIVSLFLSDNFQSDISIKKKIFISESIILHIIKMIRIFGVERTKNLFSSAHSIDFSLDISSDVGGKVGGHIFLVGPEGCGRKICAILAAYLSGYDIIEAKGLPGEEENITNKCKRSLTSNLIWIDFNTIKSITTIAYLNKFLEHDNFQNRFSPIHLMLAVQTFSQVEDALKYLPNVKDFFTVDVHSNWNLDDLYFISQHLVKPISISSDQSITPVQDSMMFIHLSAMQVALSIPSSRFIQYGKKVATFFNQMLKEIEVEQERQTVSLEKFADTKKRVTDLSNQLQEQRIQVGHIQHSCSNAVLKIRNLKSERGRLEQELAKKLSLVEQQREESLRIREVISRDLSKPKGEIRLIHKKLNRITKHELEELKNLLRPPVHIELVFEAILTILGFEPSWNEAKKQLINCFDFISNITKVSAEKIDDKMLSRIQGYLKMEELQMKNMEEDSSATITFLKWLHLFEKYARIYKDYHPLELQAEAIEKDIHCTQDLIRGYQYDLTNFVVQCQVLESQLKEREMQLEEAEEKMKTLESRIQLAQKVMKQLAQDKIHWESALQECKKRKENLFGDSLLLAAKVIYSGSLTYQQRLNIFKKWQSKLTELMVNYTPNLCALDLIAPLQDRVRWHHDEGLPFDEISIENAAIIHSTCSPQLVIDSYGILYKWIQNWSNAVECKMTDTNFKENLMKAMNGGLHLIIFQEELVINRELYEILQLDVECEYNSDVYLDTFQKFIFIKEGFKIVFVVRQCKITDSNELKFFNVVNNANQEEIIKMQLINNLIGKSQPEMTDMILRNQKEMYIRKQQLAQYEQTIRHLMSQFDEDDVDEGKLMEAMQDACLKASKTQLRCSELLESLENVKKLMKTFEQTAETLTSLYILLSKFKMSFPSFCVSLEKFISLVADELFPRNKQDWLTALDMNLAITSIQTLYRHFQKELHGPEVVCIGIALSMWYEVQLGTAKPELYNLLFYTLSRVEEHRDAKLYPVSWLTPEHHECLTKMAQLEPFCTLIDHMQSYSNLWREWWISEKCEEVDLPRIMNRSIKGFARFVLVRFLRPDRFQKAGVLYIKKIMKRIEKTPMTTVLMNLSNLVTSEPIVFVSPVRFKVETMLMQLQSTYHAALAAHSSGLKIISLGEGRENVLKDLLTRATEEGLWVLLKLNSHAETCMEELSDIVKQAQKKVFNKKFKIWIYPVKSSLIPQSFSYKCHKVILVPPDDVREGIEYIFQIIGETRIARYTTEWGKQMLICLALCHLSLISRQLMYNNGFIYPKITDSQWEEAEEVLCRYIKTGYSESLEENYSLQHYLEPIYTLKGTTEEAKRLIQSIINFYLDGNTAINISQRVAPLSCYSIPRSSALADHSTQLEDIEEASIRHLTKSSLSLIIHHSIKEGNQIIKNLSTVLDSMKTPSAVNYEKWLCKIRTLINEASVAHNVKSLSAVIKNEIIVLIEYLSKVKLILELGSDIELVLQQSLPTYFSLCIKNEEFYQELPESEVLLKKLVCIGKNILSLSSAKSYSELDLGKCFEPAVLWHFTTRTVWSELRIGAELPVVVLDVFALTPIITTEFAKAVSESETTVVDSIYLKNLVLVGAEWESCQGCITKETFPCMNFCSLIHLHVRMLTPRLKRLMMKSGKVYRAPLKWIANLISPLLWVYLPLSSQLTVEECQLRDIQIFVQ